MLCGYALIVAWWFIGVLIAFCLGFIVYLWICVFVLMFGVLLRGLFGFTCFSVW